MIDLQMQTYLYQPGDYPTTMQAIYEKPDVKIFKALPYQVGSWPKTTSTNLKHIWNNGAYMIYNDKSVVAYAISQDQDGIAWSLLVHLLRCVRQELIISFENSEQNHQWLKSPEFNLVN